MWIHRDIQPLLKARARQRPVIVMTGARQTGKTSLVRRTFSSYAYVSLDLPSEAEQAEHDPAFFLPDTDLPSSSTRCSTLPGCSATSR